MLASTVTTMQDNSAHGEDSFLSKDLGNGEFLDVVMDGGGPTVIPTVAEIRRQFTERRKGVGTLDRLLRRLLGLEAKMAQYRDGAAFVRHVVDKVGMEEFNAVFAGPGNLPTKAEIGDPAAWVARVL